MNWSCERRIVFAEFQWRYQKLPQKIFLNSWTGIEGHASELIPINPNDSWSEAHPEGANDRYNRGFLSIYRFQTHTYHPLTIWCNAHSTAAEKPYSTTEVQKCSTGYAFPRGPAETDTNYCLNTNLQNYCVYCAHKSRDPCTNLINNLKLFEYFAPYLE